MTNQSKNCLQDAIKSINQDLIEIEKRLQELNKVIERQYKKDEKNYLAYDEKYKNEDDFKIKRDCLDKLYNISLEIKFLDESKSQIGDIAKLRNFDLQPKAKDPVKKRTSLH